MKIPVYNVIWDEDAKNDLKGILRYISGQGFPRTASNVGKAIKEAANSLSYMPYYRLVDDERLARLGYRKMVVKNYNIFFKVCEAERSVAILRVIHGRRDWPNVIP